MLWVLMPRKIKLPFHKSFQSSAYNRNPSYPHGQDGERELINMSLEQSDSSDFITLKKTTMPKKDMR